MYLLSEGLLVAVVNLYFGGVDRIVLDSRPNAYVSNIFLFEDKILVL